MGGLWHCFSHIGGSKFPNSSRCLEGLALSPRNIRMYNSVLSACGKSQWHRIQCLDMPHAQMDGWIYVLVIFFSLLWHSGIASMFSGNSSSNPLKWGRVCANLLQARYGPFPKNMYNHGIRYNGGRVLDKNHSWFSMAKVYQRGSSANVKSWFHWDVEHVKLGQVLGPAGWKPRSGEHYEILWIHGWY